MYTTCRVGVLSSEISKHSKISPPPSLRSHLTSSPMGVLSGDYGSNIRQSIGRPLPPRKIGPGIYYSRMREIIARMYGKGSVNVSVNGLSHMARRIV